MQRASLLDFSAERREGAFLRRRRRPGRQGEEATRGLGRDGPGNQETDDPHDLAIY
jgi:hypothetical protein